MTAIHSSEQSCPPDEGFANRAPESLDPGDWANWRATGHRMLDEMFDYLEDIRQRPVWQPAPKAVRAGFEQPLPSRPTALDQVHAQFMEDILPYTAGNVHPGFMGWVHGGGTAVGMLAEMLAGGLNANLGGRNQMPVEVERQVSRWVAELFGFPECASGLFVTGSSMANLMGVWTASRRHAGVDVRRCGVGEAARSLRAYASSAAHRCIAQAMDLSGLGRDALRTIPVNAAQEIDTAALAAAINEDRALGLTPFMVVGSAGTVDTGAIDDLRTLASICADEGLWLHVDGAFAALGMMSRHIAPRLAGMERADSVAFDFHKWGQVPYDAGFFIARDEADQSAAFAAAASYLQRNPRGLAGGSPWPCDRGPDLSRGFRALKTWFTLKVFGTERLARMMEQTCAVARHLAERVSDTPELELLAPVALNIVCFRYRSADPDRLNAEIVADLHEMGVAAPSTTSLGGRLGIRAAIFNHRTQTGDVDRLLDAVVQRGKARSEA